MIEKGDEGFLFDHFSKMKSSTVVKLGKKRLGFDDSSSGRT